MEAKHSPEMMLSIKLHGVTSQKTVIFVDSVLFSIFIKGERDQDIDGRIILRWIFRKWEGVVGTGWSWLRIGTGGGRL